MNNTNLKEDANVILEGVKIGYSKNNPLVEIPHLEIFPGEIVAITEASVESHNAPERNSTVIWMSYSSNAFGPAVEM